MNNGLDELRRRLARRHHLFGWCGLLAFLTLGFVLEGLHGFKLDFYLSAEHKVRRELWTLAHAHGTLLSLVNVAFAAGLLPFGRWPEGRLKVASFFLLDATLLIPLGFFCGGIGHGEGDPSAGILLVPLGAVLLFIAVALTAWSALSRNKEEFPSDG